MLFNSIAFVVFFLIVFFIYWFPLKDKVRLQNIFLLFASCYFYMAFIPVYILILAVTILIDYFAGIYIERTTGKKKKLFLIISIISTCLVLFVFKYFNFFNSNFELIASFFNLDYPVSMLNIILPIGLSFHTFQSLSYVIEVYRGNQKAEHDFFTYSLYVMFFPQLVAGPIERPQHLLPQFNSKRRFDYSLASSGAKLILLGYFKKVAIADNVAPIVNGVYNSPSDYPGFPMIVATLLFAVQIYCDFSGYSDIAIGAARLLGFNLMTNFRQPYLSSSVTEFWHRWHISLSTWFRDYLYIPLGGNKKGQGRAAFNIFITFLVSGLWHGANWTFVIWGAFHGSIVVMERWLRKAGTKFRVLRFGFLKFLSIPFTFIIVCLGWIFFRANSLSDTLFIYGNMFSDWRDYGNFTKLAIKFRGLGFQQERVLAPLLFILLLLLIEIAERRELLQKFLAGRPVAKWSFYYLLLTIVLFWGYENKAENFIYFQF